MNHELVRARLTQSIQILTYVNFKLAKGDFDAAFKKVSDMIPMMTQISRPDLVAAAQQLQTLLKQKNSGGAVQYAAHMSAQMEKLLSEATTHVHLVSEFKCPHCHTNILKDSKFCSGCGKPVI